MADNRLQFSIGSVFNGEGFTKARQAVSSVNTEVKKGASTMNQLAAALGGMDAGASKAMSAMTGLVGALASMNLTTIAIQAEMIAINMWFEKSKQEVEELTKRVKEMHVAVERAFNNQMKTWTKELNDELREIDGDFEKITKQANAFAAALEGVRAASAQGGIADLEIEKLNALLDAHSDAERQTIETTYALKKAIEESANSAAEWSVKTSNAHQAVVDVEERISKLYEKEEAVAAKRAEIQEAANLMKEQEDKRWREVQAKADELKKQELDLESKRNDALRERETLLQKEKQALIEAENASKKSSAAILQAELAQTKLKEAEEKRAREEEAAAQAAKDKAWADQEAAKQQHEKELADKAAADLQREVNESASSLKKAQDEYTEALRKYNENFATNVTNEGIDWYNRNNGGLKKGGTLPVRVMNAITGTVADHAVQNAISNGLVSTVKDADKLARQAAREAREQASKQFNQQQREQQRYERLQEQNRKTWSKADSDFVEKFRAIKEAQVAQKKAVEEAKQRVEEEKRRAEKLAKDAASMAADTKNLEKLVTEVKDATKILKDAIAL